MTTTLSVLLNELVGHDIEKMSDADAVAFKAKAMSQFRIAAAGLPSLLLPGSIDLDLFIWDVEPGDDGLNWIARCA